MKTPVLLVLFSLFLLGAGAASAAPNKTALPYTFVFKDADISQVTDEILGQTLGAPFVIDPGVTGKISLKIDQRLTRTQLLEAFEAELDTLDIALVRQGETLVLKPKSKAQFGAEVRSPSEAARHAGYEVVAVPLSYASATEVAKALETLSGSKMVLYANDKTGLLLLGGSGQELSSAMESIKLFDQNGLQDAKIRWFDLERAPAQVVADDLKKVLDAANVSGVQIVALKRLNGLFIFARSPEALDQADRWIRKLDVASKEKTASLWTYHPRNVAAEDLAETVGGLLGNGSGSGQTGGSSSQQMAPSQNQGLSGFSSLGGGVSSGGLQSSPLSSMSSMTSTGSGISSMQSQRSASFGGSFASSDGGQVRISVDKTSNTILISAAASDWQDLHKTLVELDKQPPQILIEATIVEVTLTKSFQFGVDWSIFGGNGRFKASGITSASGTIGAQAPGFALAYLDTDVKAALNTLQASTDVQVVSAPKIIALDNHAASLEVGDQVPIITQSQQSTASSSAPLVNTVDYRSTGVILNVTPRVTGDDKVTLTVSQEVSAVDTSASSSISSPSIQQRHFTSSVILQSGKTVALGGLISSTKSKKPNQIPLASNVPLVGNLFKNTNDSEDRTELIVLLSAKILTDDGTADHVMADLLADMKEVKIRGLVKAP